MERRGFARHIRWALPSILVALALVFVPVAAAAPSITEFSTGSGSGPVGATLGPDGNVWLVETSANKIARVTPAGTITQFSTGLTANAGLAAITAGPDGNLWFTENSANRIGRITPAGAITEFSTGISANSGLEGIAAGPDGNLWFTESSGNRIGRITTSGSVTQFSSGISAGSNPWGITAGPDGNLWFTERDPSGGVGRITTGGVVTEFATPSGLPTGIAAGPDGNLWIAESANPGHIARVTPTGVVTEFTSGLTHDGSPAGIVAATNGNLYFTESSGAGELGQITTAGAITEFTTGLSAAPYGITRGADGNVWFTEPGGNRVGSLTVAPSAVTQPPLATSASTATLAGSVAPNSQPTTYDFQWGLTTAYGNTTTVSSAGSGAAAQTVTAAIGGLTNLATYHYRVVATNASGSTIGQDVTFMAQATPIATTGAASALGPLSATLNATVDPNSQATTYHFEWGSTASYGNWLPLMDAAVGSDSTDHAVNQVLVGLTAGATYHFRVVATNATGSSYGADTTFTTPLPPPAVLGTSATPLDQTSATLTATVDPSGAAATYHFDIGLTTAYGAQWPDADAALPASSGQQTVAQAVTGLAAGTLYDYRVVVTSSYGTTYGPDETFATAPMAGPGPTATPPLPPAGATLPPATRPVFGVSATVATISGSVLVELPHGAGYIALASASTVPFGSTIDTTHGVVSLTSARTRNGVLQRGTFWGGPFKVQQSMKEARTRLTLAGQLTCPKTGSVSDAVQRAPKPKALLLWGKDNHGRFQMRGRSAVATVRGTAWTMRDTCAGTRVTVSRGKVSVRDLVRHRTVLVKAGQSYLARSR